MTTSNKTQQVNANLFPSTGRYTGGLSGFYVSIGNNKYVKAEGVNSKGEPINPEPQVYKLNELGQYVPVRKLKV